MGEDINEFLETDIDFCNDVSAILEDKRKRFRKF